MSKSIKFDKKKKDIKKYKNNNQKQNFVEKKEVP